MTALASEHVRAEGWDAVDEAFARGMLVDAYGLVRDGWCQGAEARDFNGKPIEPSSVFARAWSASGALTRLWVRSTDDPELALRAFERARRALVDVVGELPERWNDDPERMQADVLKAFGQAFFMLSRSSAQLASWPARASTA